MIIANYHIRPLSPSLSREGRGESASLRDNYLGKDEARTA